MIRFQISNKHGFSLVELLVVVAIIAILASLAIPEVTKFQAKARQSEAKALLSSLYSAEKAFHAEYAAYHSAFAAIGFSPEGTLRYNVGFYLAGNGGNAGPANGYNASPVLTNQTLHYCGSVGVFSQGCSILVGTTNQPPMQLNPTVGPPTTYGTYGAPPVNTVWDPTSTTNPGACEVQALGLGSTFLACATASIYKDAVDFWTIDRDKKVLNLTVGIP